MYRHATVRAEAVRSAELGIHTHRMLVDQASAEQTCKGDHAGGNQGQKKPPRDDEFAGFVEPQQPVERRQGQHHDGHQRVAPAVDQASDMDHGQQVDHPDRTCYPTAQGSNPRQPEPGPGPKRITHEEIGEIYRHKPDQGRDRKVDKQRMQRMPGDRSATDNGLLLVCHHHLLQGLKVESPSMLPAWARLTSFLAILPLLGACSGPYSILDPASSSTRITAGLWWGMFFWFTLVLVAVVLLWIYAMRRKPREFSAERSRKVGRRWIIGGGLILPLASIAVLLGFGIPLGHRMLPEEDQPAVRIDMTGHQWWWEIRYPDAGVVTANHLHIPAGRNVDIHVTAADVIHSFWVPRLAGKMDMIPGDINVIRLQAERPGLYYGHCGEFCGLQHANMALTVQAQPEEEFTAWLEARQEPPEIAPEQQEAVALFQTYCSECHRVAGVSAGRTGPDLTDVGSRPTLGAGVLAQDEGAFNHWLGAHQSLKPGNRMPEQGEITPAELGEIADWLETLSP